MTMKSALSLKAIIGIISAAVVTVAAVIVAITVFGKEESYRLIKVFEVNGSAVIERSEIGTIDAYQGMSLESGDVISVSEDSLMRLSLDDDKYILVEGGTQLMLEATGTSDNSRTSITLMNGAILNEITTKLPEGSSFEVNTPKATMSVRGTSFRVSVTTINGKDYITDVQTFEGTVGAQLLDENGNPKGAEVKIPSGKSAKIETKSTSGLDASVDGVSEFVFTDNDIDFDELPPVIVAYIVASYESGNMVYPEEIVNKAREAMLRNEERTHIRYTFTFPTDSG